MVFERKNSYFLEKRQFWTGKPIFLLGKTKQTKKTSFGKLCGQSPKRCFLISPRKKLVFHADNQGKYGFGQKNQLFPKRWFWAETQLFPCKKMVLSSKTYFFHREKLVFGMRNQLFPRENHKNNRFGLWPHSVPQDGFLVFPMKKFGFPVQNYVFHRKKLVSHSKTIFFLGKTKKTIFWEFGRIVSSKTFFWFFGAFPWETRSLEM